MSIVMLATSRVNRTRRAVGRHRHLLVHVGTVELHRVTTALPLDGIAAITRVPRERVLATAEEGRIGTAASVDLIVTASANQQIRAITADQRVVPRAADQA